MRKFYVGFITLAAIVVIYLFYSRLETTPDVGRQNDFIDTITDSNIDEFEPEVGKIGDIGVGDIKDAFFIKRNENQEVVREIGFKRVLHKIRDVWETEKPFINIYRRNFKCNITADSGTILVETAVGITTPKDATFTSNVVIHILPVGSSGVKESFIYLDDITFLSEKSLLTTTNSVRFVSDDARMLGKGLELVYDDMMERLEYLWIIDLESLHIKKSQAEFFTGSKKITEKTLDPNTPSQTKQLDEIITASETTQTQITSTEPPTEKIEGEYYNCVFSKNVLIDSPDELVFAEDKIFINDIFWSKTRGGEPNEVDVDAKDTSAGESNKITAANEQSQQSSKKPGIDEIITAKSSEPNELSQELQDIVITCDNGFIIALKDSPKLLEKINRTVTETEIPDTSSRLLEKFDLDEGRRTFLSKRIDYNAFTDDVIATGESKLKFYTADLGQTDPNKPALPVIVTARQQVRFLQSLNQAVFEGDCESETIQTDPNFEQQYKLLAPRLIIDLVKDINDETAGSTPNIKHFTADGGLVRLQSLKTAGEKLISGVVLESGRFDYDPAEDLFEATGTGEIRVNNSGISSSATGPDKFSLRKPCFAVVREFKTLKYFLKENRLVADAPSERLLIDYFPIVDGKYGKQIKAVAGHIEAFLVPTPNGQTELSTLTATRGIEYLDDESKNEFIGSKLFYDHKKSEMKVTGDQAQPCYYNGTLVDKIDYDLKTGNVKAEVVGPAILQLK